MKIAIIGGGSLGLLFTYYLSLKHEVFLYTRSQEQADIINNHGVKMIKGDVSYKVDNIAADPFKAWQGAEQLTIVAVKQYQLMDLMPVLKEKSSGSLLFLQNGYSHVQLLQELTASSIYVGSVEHGAVRENHNTVYHNGVGATRAALFSGDEALLRNLSSSMGASFPISIESDYHAMLTKKLVVNAVINPLTALLQVKNGELISNSFYRKILIQLFEECVTVLDLHNQEEYFQNLLAVCEKTATNHSSMLKDLQNGRQTEIEAILGYLLEEAARKNIQAPLLHNYYHCIRGKEQERENV